mmetsp:Transcript_29804/g.83986  ORF Transcript_29804/g.83986 Transcript_29804/m.83986 type:complete len:206 (-) Transcript_29804:124-741(-)
MSSVFLLLPCFPSSPISSHSGPIPLLPDPFLCKGGGTGVQFQRTQLPCGDCKQVVYRDQCRLLIIHSCLFHFTPFPVSLPSAFCPFPSLSVLRPLFTFLSFLFPFPLPPQHTPTHPTLFRPPFPFLASSLHPPSLSFLSSASCPSLPSLPISFHLPSCPFLSTTPPIPSHVLCFPSVVLPPTFLPCPPCFPASPTPLSVPVFLSF